MSRAFADATVGLYVPPESAKYVYVWRWWFWQMNIEVGGPAKEACLQTLKQLFADAYEVSAPPPGSLEGEPDFVIVQTIEKVEIQAAPYQDFTQQLRSVTPVMPRWRAQIQLRWDVLDPGGNHLFSLTESAEDTTDPADPDKLRAFAESVGKKVVAAAANDLRTHYAGKISEVLAQRAKTVAFLGWVCPSDLESMGAVLSEPVQKAVEASQYQTVSADVVAAALQRQDTPLSALIADKSRMATLTHSLRCGFLLAGRVEREGENLHLYLVKYDRVTGARGASAEQVAQADDVKGIIAAVEKMLSSLQLGQLAR